MPLTPGLLYLLASVACSVTVAVLLKLARRWRIDVGQAIAMNYLVAALLCWAVLRPDAAGLLAPRTPWLVLAAPLNRLTLTGGRTGGTQEESDAVADEAGTLRVVAVDDPARPVIVAT